MDEFLSKLVERLRLHPDRAARLRQSLVTQIVLVRPMKLPSQVCRDKDDDVVLGIALAGECDTIITGLFSNSKATWLRI